MTSSSSAIDTADARCFTGRRKGAFFAMGDEGDEGDVGVESPASAPGVESRVGAAKNAWPWDLVLDGRVHQKIQLRVWLTTWSGPQDQARGLYI